MKKLTYLTYFAFAFAGISVYLSSCCKALCLDASLTIFFQNYTKAEADTIVVSGYKLNTNFTVKVDSVVLIKPYAATDTTKSQDFHNVYPDRDFIIRVTSLNKEFRISDDVIIDQKCACENKKQPILKSLV